MKCEAVKGLKEFQLGESAFEQRAFEAALQHYNKALTLDPACSSALHGRAYAQRKLGDLNGAVSSITEYIEARPNNTGARAFRGVCLCEQGQVSGAIEDYTMAIEQQQHTNGSQKRGADSDENLADFYSNRGEAQLLLGSVGSVAAASDFAQAMVIEKVAKKRGEQDDDSDDDEWTDEQLRLRILAAIEHSSQCGLGLPDAQPFGGGNNGSLFKMHNLKNEEQIIAVKIEDKCWSDLVDVFNGVVLSVRNKPHVLLLLLRFWCYDPHLTSNF